MLKSSKTVVNFVELEKKKTMPVFYVRCLIEKIPEDKKNEIAFREDRNYPVLGVDHQSNKIFVPDDKQRLLWLPNNLFRFIKLS